jgi:hypothetical protein
MKFTPLSVATALANNGLAHAGRTMQQDAPGRGNAGALKEFRIQPRPLVGFLENPLRRFEAADVAPAHVRQLGEDFADRRGLAQSECILEVFHLHRQIFELLVGNLIEPEIDVGQDLAQPRHRRFAAERVQIGANITVGHLRQALEIDVLRQRHAPGVDLQDLQSSRLVGHADGNFTIEPAGPT